MITKCLLFFSFKISLVTAGYCYSGYDTTYCPHGCCGSYDSPCCSSPPVVSAVAVGIGGILIFLVAIILAFCCCCCIRRRHMSQRGTVGQPTTVVSTVQYPSPGVYPYPRAIQQPGFTSQTRTYPQPPAYSQQPTSPVSYSQPPTYQQSIIQGCANRGFGAVPLPDSNQTQKKADPTAPPPYEP